MPFILSQADRSHAAILSDLHSACFDRGWGETEFHSFFDRDHIIALIAYDQETPIGFAFAWVVAEQCELLAIAVLEQHRGKGVAHTLADALLEQARALGAKQIFLEVSVKNQAARHLYEHREFTITGRRSNYYRMNDGSFEDAITMVKEI